VNKKSLIYQAASEAVMRSRIELNKYLCSRLPSNQAEAVDNELSKAMHRAGEFAVRAYEADARKISALPQLFIKPTER